MTLGFKKEMDQNNFLDFEKEKTNHLTSVPGSHWEFTPKILISINYTISISVKIVNFVIFLAILFAKTLRHPPHPLPNFN